MVRNTFKEDKESFWATFQTKWGWISFVLSNLIYGYLILNYIDIGSEMIQSYLVKLPEFLINPALWILLGIASSISGFIILLIVEQFVKISGIKNKRIF